MSSAPWNEELAGRLSELERQHQELLKRAGRFFDMVENGRGATATRSALVYLDSYVRFHFAREEQCMMQLNFPGAQEHRREHAAAVRRLKAIQSCLEHHVEEATTAHELEAFLKGWLKNHIGRADHAFGEYARAMLLATSKKTSGA